MDLQPALRLWLDPAQEADKRAGWQTGGHRDGVERKTGQTGEKCQAGEHGMRGKPLKKLLPEKSFCGQVVSQEDFRDGLSLRRIWTGNRSCLGRSVGFVE